MSAEDLIQRIREGIVAIIDPHARVVAITGRPEKNIVSWRTLAKGTQVPVLAYHFVVDSAAPIEGDGAHLLQFTAVAEDEATANALVGLVPQLLTQAAFAALPTPLDAIVLGRPVRHGVPYDTDEAAHRADLDLTIIA